MSKSRWYAAAPGLGVILLFLSTVLAEPTADQAGTHNIPEMKFAPG